ncbi:Putative uncharacterized protein [Taphrina deformans PYCC 5710]|uniref:Spindle pole body component n=1 Tax=Taphrina deformans (strain PYCC 5710 / ATCC 11124 / CBS 356.35 / IMI 108563 / JCM 9778 / NBRC 8474) TaxID=1097556 RepID=R4X796_TAPDE|nr:Putative uncharacterized protein [Taphrina deformans PYCC 5710]|eukprot:CCG81171.1 Putative uncharacterized protein [Taphrina deformans PYCC 5710]
MSCTNVTDIILQLSDPGVSKLSSRNDIVSNAVDVPDALVAPLLEIAHVNQRVRKISFEVARSDSVMVRVVACEVTRYASKFLERLSNVHQMVLKRDPGVVVEGEISLIRLRTLLNSSALILRHLQNVVLELRAIDERQPLSMPASLINNLHLDALTGYEDLKPLSNDLRKAADRMYIQQIKTWCLYGRLYSQFLGDFFVRIDTNGELVYRADDCPAMISPETSRRIFELGRILYKIYADRPTDKLHIGNNDNLSMHESSFTSLSLPLEANQLDAVVEEVGRTISRTILSSILPRSRVRSFVLFLKDFFLLGNGEFTLRLIQATQVDFRSMRQRHLGTLKDDTVHAVLAKTLSSLTVEDTQRGDAEDSDEPDHAVADWRALRMTLDDENNDQRSSFAHFLYGVPVQLKFQLKWPLDILVTPDDLEQYGHVFNYLISLRRAQERLHSLWRGRRASGTHASITTAAWSSAFRTQAFLGTMIEYYHGTVVSAYSKRVERAVADHYETHDPARLSQQHRDAFMEMKRAVLMAEHDFLGIMHQLFTTVDQVVEALDRNSEHTDRCKVMVRLVERAINELTMENGVDTLLLKLQVDSGLQI